VVFYSISSTCQATCNVFQKLQDLSRFRLCFCVLYPRESPGHVATLAHVLKWCTRPRDTSKCMILHQDQLPTLPMERERAFNYSIALANTGRLRLWPLKPMQSYHLFLLTYPLHISSHMQVILKNCEVSCGLDYVFVYIIPWRITRPCGHFSSFNWCTTAGPQIPTLPMESFPPVEPAGQFIGSCQYPPSTPSPLTAPR
jgi:hypothetical protein